MQELINLLKSNDLINSNGVNSKKVNSLSISQFVDLNIEIKNTIQHGECSLKKTPFSHTASLNLGGSALECDCLECRFERIRRLIQFALLYSDQVTISSFFATYSSISDKDNLDFYLDRFRDDLEIIFKIQKPLASGLIQLIQPETDVCFTCQAQQFIGRKAAIQFPKAYRELQNDFLKNMDVACQKTQYGYDFHCKGLFPEIVNSSIQTWDKLPHQIAKRHRINANIENNKIVNLSKTLIKEIGLHTDLAHLVATNAIFGLSASHQLGTNFLTDNDLHLSFLNSLHTDNNIIQKNRIAANRLTSVVPFAENVNINNLLKLRDREQEAFIAYRQALSKTINEFTNGTLSDKEAKQLYSDIIEPALARLDIKVKKAKKDLISRPIRSLTGVVGSISFGLLTGLIPPDLTAITSALGVVKFGNDLIKDIMATGDKEDTIKDNQFYFLWKVRNL